MFRRVYANGPTGTELSEVVKSLKGYDPVRSVKGQALRDAFVEKKLGIDFIAYLDSEDFRFQEERWVDAFLEAVRSATTGNPRVALLLTNAPYFRKSRFFPPAILDVFNEFTPQAVITFIEEGHVAWARIRKREERYRSRSIFRLKDMFTWRSVSIMHAATIARHLRIPHYVFPVKQPVSSLYKLLFTREPRVYLSFPITQVRDDERAVNEINEFRARLHAKTCAFDPITADDRVPQHVFTKARKKGLLGSNEGELEIKEEDRWPLDKKRPELKPLVDDYVYLDVGTEPVYPIRIPVDQVREVSEPGGNTSEPSEIDKNILYRDVLFILQCDLVVAYRPNYQGSLSMGSYFEINYAANVAKKRVLVYWDRSEDGDPASSPFMGFGVFFNDIDTLLNQLEESVPRIN